VEDLLAEVEVLEQRRAALAEPQRVLVVANRNPCCVVSTTSSARWCNSPPFPRTAESPLAWSIPSRMRHLFAEWSWAAIAPPEISNAARTSPFRDGSAIARLFSPFALHLNLRQ
jgi:hypothetical protein